MVEPSLIIELSFNTWSVPASKGMYKKQLGRVTKDYTRIAYARYTVFRLLINSPEWSIRKLAELFGMDERSIYIGIDKVNNAKCDSELYQKYHAIVNRINET